MALAPFHSSVGQKPLVTQAADKLAPMGQAKFANQTLLSPQDVHKEKVLNAISQAESSGGKNQNHKTIQHGFYAGQQAYGKYGLLKPALQEVVHKYPDTLPGLKDFSHEGVVNYFKKNPHLEKEAASKYFDIIHRSIGTDEPGSVGYSWLQGPGAYHVAKKLGSPIQDHWYAKKIQNYYNQVDKDKKDVR